VQRGRQAVVGEYRRQFAADQIESYKLSGLNATGGRAGRAEAQYTVSRKNASPITGRLVLGVIRRGGEARIDLIATEPRG
jgi:serine/threonine-protein kinase